jgi:hypothetical protein
LADYPRGHHDLKLAENPVKTRLPHSQALRKVYLLLSLEAESRALAGDNHEAIRCVHGILHTAASIRDEPTLISQLIRAAGRRVAVNKANRILALGVPDEELAELQDHFDRERKEDLMAVAIRGERAMFHRFCQNIEAGKLNMFEALDRGGGPVERSDFHNWRYKPHVSYNHALGLRLCNQALEISKLTWGARQAAMDGLPMPAHERETAMFHLLFTQLMSDRSVFSGIQAAAVRDQALLRCAVVGIACERYRLEYQEWPATLETIPRDLLSELPDDPYSGKPLRYRHTEDGVVVYSVGPNLADDGGDLEERPALVAMDKDDNGLPRLRVGVRPGDIGFRLWNPNRRGLELLPTPQPED